MKKKRNRQENENNAHIERLSFLFHATVLFLAITISLKYTPDKLWTFERWRIMYTQKHKRIKDYANFQHSSLKKIC